MFLKNDLRMTSEGEKMYNERDENYEKPKRGEEGTLYRWAKDVLVPLILSILAIFTAGTVVTIIYAPEFVLSITTNNRNSAEQQAAEDSGDIETVTSSTSGLSCTNPNATCLNVDSKDMTGKATYTCPTDGIYTISIRNGSYNVYGDLGGWWRTRVEGFVNRDMSSVQPDGQIGPVSDFFVGNDEVQTEEFAESMWQGKSRVIECQEGDVLRFTAKDTWNQSAYSDNEGEVELHIQAPN